MYTGPAEAADSYTLSRERHVEVDGEFADAVLGRFQKGKDQFMIQPTPACSRASVLASAAEPLSNTSVTVSRSI